MAIIFKQICRIDSSRRSEMSLGNSTAEASLRLLGTPSRSARDSYPKTSSCSTSAARRPPRGWCRVAFGATSSTTGGELGSGATGTFAGSDRFSVPQASNDCSRDTSGTTGAPGAARISSRAPSTPPRTPRKASPIPEDPAFSAPGAGAMLGIVPDARLPVRRPRGGPGFSPFR